MANYFKHYNKTFYNKSDQATSLDVLTNLTTRISFVEKYADNTALYYLYTIQDGDTPDIVAHKLYASSEYHWIILLFNNILDPQYDWPLEQRNLGLYIDSKYSSKEYANTSNTNAGLAWAQSHTKEYNVTETTLIVGTNDSYSNTFVVDSSTYANTIVGSSNFTLKSGDVLTISTTKSAKSYFDHEVEFNDSKRTIRILKPEFLDPVIREFKSLVK